MENVFMVLVWTFFGLIAFIVIRESLYQRRKRKVVPGARFNNKLKGDAAPLEWVTVTSAQILHFTVWYRIDGELEERCMDIRDFVRIYVP